MDRQVVYLGQVPRSLDLLLTNQNTMTALAKLSEAVLGTTTIVQGFSLSATAPASMNLVVGAGQIYQQENLEATAISGLAVDTHTIVKQGINLDPTTVTFVAPGTVGFAQNFLVEAQYADSDSAPIVLTFQNPSNPTQTYQGPGGNGLQSNTVRKGVVAIQIKAGVAATSGTQTTPTPDAGWAGLYVVTVAYGQTQVTSGNFSIYSASSFIPVTLPGVPAGVQAGQWVYGNASGTNTYAVTLNPTPAALATGMEIVVNFSNANTSTSPTLNANGLGARPVVKQGGGAPAAGDIVGYAPLIYDGANWRVNGLVTSDILAIVTANAPTKITAFANIYVRPDGNDSTADGSANTAAKAFATITAAITYGLTKFSFGGLFGLNILLGVAGTYAPPGRVVGTTTINIVGDLANQGNYILSGPGVLGSGLVIANCSQLNLSGLTINNTGNVAHSCGVVTCGSLGLTNVSLTQSVTNPSHAAMIALGGSLVLNGGCIVAGGVYASIFAGSGSGTAINLAGALSITSSPAFTNFISTSDTATFNNIGGSISGSGTGTRYSALTNSVIDTGGSGANFFPGSAAGGVGTGGQYV